MNLSQELKQDFAEFVPVLYRYMAVLIALFLVTQYLVIQAQATSLPLEIAKPFALILGSPLGTFIFFGAFFAWFFIVYRFLILFGRFFNRDI